MASATEPAREIHPEVLYRMDELQKRVGMGEWAFRKARLAGLKVIRKNGKSWVFGGDFIAYMRGESAQTN